MLLTKTGLRCLAGVVLAILPSATPGADAAQPSTPPTTVSSLRTALDSARASLHSRDQQAALSAVNALLTALALAGVDIRVKRDAAQDQTVITMRVFQNGQLRLATCANADCFEATVGCAAEILKAFEPAQPVPVQPVPEKAPGVPQK